VVQLLDHLNQRDEIAMQLETSIWVAAAQTEQAHEKSLAPSHTAAFSVHTA
jgi:hypothetical protein